ncbi:hypothetical protein TNCV_2237831 [Trichonephila clavipes]|nr:hypothetical protein TNCV_2237831 [Trichonephila clavipes]
MQVSFGTQNNSSPNEPSCTTVTVSFNGVLLVVTVYEDVDQSALSVCTRSALKLSYQWLKRADETGRCCAVSFANNCRIPVFIRRQNSGETSAVTSTHITITLESFPKPGDDTLGDFKFLG